MTDTNVTFDTDSLGDGLKYPILASVLRSGGHILLHGKPYRITKLDTLSKNRIFIEGVDIFTGKTIEEEISKDSIIDVPIIVRRKYQLVDVEDEFISLTDEYGRGVDIKFSGSEQKNKIVSGFNNNEDLIVTILSSMGEDRIDSFVIREI